MREETRLVAYPMSDVKIIVDNNILALAQNVKEKTLRQRRSILAIGDASPAAYGGMTEGYELELTHIPANDEVSFAGDGFTVLLIRDGKRTEYRSCVCLRAESEQRPGEPAVETVLLRAGSRREVLI